MCGRYALSKLPSELIEEFEITAGHVGSVLPADWNIAPTREIYIIRDNQELKRELVNVSWGLIAPWSKDPIEALRSQSQAINARTETVHEKPTFRSAFRSRRCLIPATGYYEWATELGKYETKQPFYIHSEDEISTLAFAGIYDRWVNANGEIFESAAIITREAVDFLATIHHRMPTFLPRDSWEAWLDPRIKEVSDIRKIMEVATPTQGLAAHPVSTSVNATRNNGAALIEKVELGDAQTLF
jgi:putative SOS response-associated peptidase YedK